MHEDTESTTEEITEIQDDRIVPSGELYDLGGSSISVYNWIGDGGRPLLRVGYDTITGQVYIAAITGPIQLMDPDMWKGTKGIAHSLSELVSYIVGRIPTMMGRVYVPKP